MNQIRVAGYAMSRFKNNRMSNVYHNCGDKFRNKHNVSQSLSCFRTDNQSKFTFSVIVKKLYYYILLKCLPVFKNGLKRK